MGDLFSLCLIATILFNALLAPILKQFHHGETKTSVTNKQTVYRISNISSENMLL